MTSIKDQVAVITVVAWGIEQALAIEIARRGSACIALIDFSEQILQVAGNAEVGRVVTIAYRGDTTDAGFRHEVYADFTSKAGVPRICVPAPGITKDALAVSMHQTEICSRCFGPGPLLAQGAGMP
jgi:3-oxoacyl-[acyl-carrier protein] reductase